MGETTKCGKGQNGKPWLPREIGRFSVFKFPDKRALSFSLPRFLFFCSKVETIYALKGLSWERMVSGGGGAGIFFKKSPSELLAAERDFHFLVRFAFCSFLPPPEFMTATSKRKMARRRAKSTSEVVFSIRIYVEICRKFN